MADGENVGVYSRIEANLEKLRAEQSFRLDRIEDKLDRRMTDLDAKVDGLGARQDRLEGKLEGTLGIIKWLGPVGLAALVFGLMTVYGLLPVPIP